MGLFGGSKKTYVSSSVYNLAGDEVDRPNYLKTLIAGKIIADTDATQSMTEAITGSYLTGPGIKLRNYAKWGISSGYNDMLGMLPTILYLDDTIDDTVLSNYIPHDADQTVVIQSSDVGTADYTWWAEQYVAENHPSLLNTDWTADINDTNVITITYADTTTESFTAADFDDTARYIYASYTLSADPVAKPIVTGDTISLGSSGDFPSVVGWTQNSYVAPTVPVTLTKTITTTKVYSDGRPNLVTQEVTTSSDTYLQIAGEWEKTVFEGTNALPDGSQELHKTRSIMYQNQNGSAADNPPTSVETTYTEAGVTVTQTDVTVTQSVLLDRSYRVDTQDIVSNSFTFTKVFMYKFGSGNSVLDAMFAPQQSSNMFDAFIPVRIDNDMITDDRFDQYYPLCEKAYKKATGKKFVDLIDIIKTNDSLGDIDYGYVTFGVSLNVKENACKKYIYNFFQTMLETSTGVTTAYGNYQTQMALATSSQEAWQAWYNAQSDSTNPAYGTAEPTKIPYPTLPTNSIQMKSSGLMNFNMTVSWSAIAETTGTGMRDSTKNVGDLWFVQNADDNYEQIVYTGGTNPPVNAFSVTHVTLYWQVTATSWRAMNIWGLTHNNKIYNAKSVKISAKDALNDSAESGFIIPLQNDIYKTMSIVDATQMSTACIFMVFNCYQVVKKPWYATSIFKIVIIIVAIVITVYSGGVGAGLLGTAASIGASVGLVGITAVIVGAIANALAAMILIKLIQVGSTAVFGDKVGAIVGAVASVIALAVGGSMSNGGSIMDGFSSLTTAANISQLTIAAGNGYAGYMAAAAQDTLNETQDILTGYAAKTKEISSQYDSVIGSDNGMIDPLAITAATNLIIETNDSFLSRTLMTGSDIADMSKAMLNQFVGMTTSTDLSYGA